MVEINQNLLDQLYDKYKDLPLLINEKQCWTFAEFFNEAYLISNSLSTDPQKRIGLCSENLEFLLLAMMAIWMREAIVVPLNPKFPARQKEELLRKVKCDITLSENYTRTNSQSQITRGMPLLNPDAWSTIIFTSGSSGFPKAVVHTLANHFFSALGANKIMPLKPGDRWLMSLPLFHVGGLAILFRSLLSGSSIVIPAKKKTLIQNIEENQITHLSLVPTQLQRLLKTGKGRKSLHKMKLILLGGSAIPESLMEHSSKLGLKLRTTYGSTEMASQVATSRPIKTKKGWLAAGEVMPFCEVRIAPQNEIELRGNTLFCGYLSESGLSQPFDNQGWFSSGDTGYLIKKNNETNLQKIDLENKTKKPQLAAKNDYLIVSGRKDSMFISGGENIHPEEIERSLLQFQDTERAAVVAVKDPEFGQRPVAFVKSSVSVSEYELRKFLEKSLTRFKIPELFLPWPEFAEDGLKPARKELTQTAQSHYDRLQKRSLGKNTDSFFNFEQWLKKFPIGWMRIAQSKGRQVFLVFDLRNKHKIRCLYVRASSRAEVMEWMLAKENRVLIDEQHEKNQTIKWFQPGKTNRTAARESFEIIRIIEEELPTSKMQLYDASDRGEFKTSLLQAGRLRKESLKKTKVLIDENQYMIDLLKEFNSGWKWKFPEAVFQFGICIPEFQRMYLLRCLYRRADSEKKFLGWKVQLLKDFSKSEDLEIPFWDISSGESNALEKKMLQSGLISADEHQNANTPLREIKRRAEFQTQIDELFN